MNNSSISRQGDVDRKVMDGVNEMDRSVDICRWNGRYEYNNVFPPKKKEMGRRTEEQPQSASRST